MGLSEYDKTHVGAILGGEGSWWSARLLRGIADLIQYADEDNQKKLYAMWPEEVTAVLKWWGWSDSGIEIKFRSSAGAFPRVPKFPTLMGQGFEPYDTERDGEYEMLDDDGTTCIDSDQR